MAALALGYRVSHVRITGERRRIGRVAGYTNADIADALSRGVPLDALSGGGDLWSLAGDAVSFRRLHLGFAEARSGEHILEFADRHGQEAFRRRWVEALLFAEAHWPAIERVATALLDARDEHGAASLSDLAAENWLPP